MEAGRGSRRHKRTSKCRETFGEEWGFRTSHSAPGVIIGKQPRCVQARKHHEERRVKEAARMEELVAAFRGGSARLSITSDELENVDSGQGANLNPGLASSGRIGWLGGGRQK